MPSLQTLRETVLEKIRPLQSEIEESHRVFSNIQEQLQREAEEKGLEIAFIELEGSAGAKQTQLRNRRELDVFVGLPPSVLFLKERKPPSKTVLGKFFRKLVKEVALKAVKQAGGQSPSIAYAEHPYVSAILEDFKLDVVFCFDLSPEYLLENGPITAVDRTPHHSRFVDSNLSLTQRDDVRLLKAFLISSFVYGDASPVGRSGFTGFSAEMLIYHTQSFDTSIEFLTHKTLEPLDYFTRSTEELKQLFNEPIIITDPTDPNRNVAASISIRAYNYSTKVAQELLKEPQPSFFSMEPVPVLTPAELDTMSQNFFVIEFYDETGWHYTKTRDKLYRYSDGLQRFLSHEYTGEQRFGTVIFEEVFNYPIFAIALYVDKIDLESSFIRAGPRANFSENVDEFRKKHPKAFLRDDRYYASVLRPFTKVEHALRYFLTENQLSGKLALIDISHQGITTVGQQALWILVKAILPYEHIAHTGKK